MDPRDIEEQLSVMEVIAKMVEGETLRYCDWGILTVQWFNGWYVYTIHNEEGKLYLSRKGVLDILKPRGVLS